MIVVIKKSEPIMTNQCKKCLFLNERLKIKLFYLFFMLTPTAIASPPTRRREWRRGLEAPSGKPGAARITGFTRHYGARIGGLAPLLAFGRG